MSTVLNRSEQSFGAIGLVNELNLVREDCEIKVRDKDGNDNGTKQGERIRGKIALRMGNAIKTFDVFVPSLNNKGAESGLWKNAEAMLDLNPEIGGDKSEDASLVVINGRVAQNDFISNKGELVSGLRWNVSRVSTRVNDDDTHACTLSGNFFIRSIKPEVVNEEETGRLNVVLVGVDYGASPIIVNTIVKEDIADDFIDAYEVGQTAKFYIESESEHVGQKTNDTKVKFGNKGTVSTTSNGYDRETLVIVGGEEALDEPENVDENGNLIDNGWIDPKAMKTALKERENKLEEMRNEGKKSTTSADKKSGLRNEKSKSKTKPKSLPKHPAEDDDDTPFDLDEDDEF